MTANITKSQIDLVQGEDEQGRKFGYVCGDDGGFFFTWMPTLEATIASIEEDEVDGDGDLDESEVAEFLRKHLPTTARGKLWTADTTTVYVVRDASGEYISGKYDRDDTADSPNRTPAADEAREYETREEAQAACRRATDRVLSREVDKLQSEGFQERLKEFLEENPGDKS